MVSVEINNMFQLFSKNIAHILQLKDTTLKRMNMDADVTSPKMWWHSTQLQAHSLFETVFISYKLLSFIV